MCSHRHFFYITAEVIQKYAINTAKPFKFTQRTARQGGAAICSCSIAHAHTHVQVHVRGNEKNAEATKNGKALSAETEVRK